MLDGDNTPSEGLTLEQAYAQLTTTRQQALEKEHPEDGSEDVEAEAGDIGELEDQELDEDQDPDNEGDPEDPDSEDSEDSEEEEDEVFEVESDDGTIEEVTAEELHKGYLRQKDYTRKRQADAKRARELEADYTTKINSLNAALSQNVSYEQKQYAQLEQQYKQSSDDTERRDIHYRMLQLQQSIGQRNAQLQQAQALRAQQEQALLEANWNTQQELLQAEYEDWDTKKDELVNYLTSSGFEDQDLAMFAHHKMAKLVDKAKQFDELQQQRKTVAKKKIRRKVPKVMKSGQGEKKFNVNQDKVRKLADQFARTGSIQDAMALRKAKRGN